MHTRPHPLAALAAAFALAAAIGCGSSTLPPLGTVTGTVTLDGRPVPHALVTFTPEGPGRTSGGMTDAEGTYVLSYLQDVPGANVARHRVRISTVTEPYGFKETLPDRYHGQTQLTADVAAGANTIDFPLESR